MYTNDNSHRFPALLMAACLTASVVIGLSALAHSRLGTVSPDSRLMAATPVASRLIVSDTSVVPFHIEVVATSPQA
jgi:hypothetical protein